MAITYMTGFETSSGDNEKDTVTSEGIVVGGAATFNTTTPRTGTYSILCDAPSGTTAYLQLQGVANAFLHFGLRIATFPSVARRIFGGASGCNVNLNTDGTLEAFESGSSQGVSSTALQGNVWYWIGWRTTAGTSVPLVQIDGLTEITGTVTAATLLNVGFSNNEASAASCRIDDMIMNDSFLGPSNVALLVPISDNARDTLWTGGAGGTTNLFNAVDNIPPIGSATEANNTQIEHAGGAAGTTDRYDANMTSYSTAGINAGDTVLAIQYFINHGEDITTGTKLLNFSLVSNPTQATGRANFSAGDGVGALGTWPTNWKVRINTIVSSPSVTLGTSPVMRVVRPETAARVASVCSMGMYVAWTPLVIEEDRAPELDVYPQILSH